MKRSRVALATATALTIGAVAWIVSGTDGSGTAPPSTLETAESEVVRDPTSRPPTEISLAPAPARRAIPTRLSKIELGDVTLAVGVPVAFQVSNASGRGTIAEISISQSWMPTQPLATMTSTAEGRAEFDALPPGTYGGVALGAAGRAAFWFTLPKSSAGPIEIVLAELRSVDVTVIARDTRAPVADARIELFEELKTPDGSYTTRPYLPRIAVPPTNPKGQTALTGLERGAKISVSVTAPGFPPPSSRYLGQRADRMVPPVESSMEIVLDAGRTVTWEVTPGEVPPPPEGTVLTLEQQSGSGTAPPYSTGRMWGGRIVVEGVSAEPTHWLAVAPDGSRAALFSLPGDSEGRATSFGTTRKVEVTLRWSDGAPASGLFVSVRNQGNNPTGATATTDAKGFASIERLESQMVDVYVETQNTPYSGRRVGTADLKKGSAHVEAILPTRREGTISVFLDGAAGLPPTIGTMFSGGFGGAAEIDITRRDPGTGALGVVIWPVALDGNAVFGLDSPGWQAQAPISIVAGSGPFQARLDLRRVGSVDVELVQAKGGRVTLQLERVEEPGAAPSAAVRYYSSNSYGSGQARIDAEGHWRLPTIAPGRYRVRDTVSSTTSDMFDVVAGATASIRLDVSTSGTVEGIVIVPEGESAAGLTIHLVPAPSRNPSQPNSPRTGVDGHFRITVPGGRDVELTALHPLLIPAPEGGNARVRAGSKDATIRLARSPVCRVPFDRALSTASNGPGANPIYVYLWKGEMAGPPARTVAAVVEGAQARFSHYDAGTYSVLVDLPSLAPVVLTNVRLGDAETTLDPVTLSTGTTITMTVSARPGQSPPRIGVTAVRLGALPAYQRSSAPNDPLRVAGLGRGRFRVWAFSQMDGATVFEQEVEVDGTTDSSFRVDLK